MLYNSINCTILKTGVIMAIIDDDKLARNSYSGLKSFNENSVEKELELLKQLGADVEKLRALKFNALQLAEIRKGINDKVDVKRYMDPSMPWTAMEEMRLEMYQGIDMSEYRKKGFDVLQLAQIRQGLVAGVDVSQYARKDFFADQMREVRLGLNIDNPVPVIFYLDPAFDSLQMREIRKGLQAGIDISSYASVSTPFLKMRAIRESAEDGLIFTPAQIEGYNASILNQLHKAFLDEVDISKYIADRFDDEQLEEVRIAIKKGLPIDDYISGEMRGDAIREIRLGLESGVDVHQYADAAYNWQQMYEMRIGLEHQIDITPYRKPLYQADQMREIRLGIEDGLDISRYSSLMYTARDMRRIRLKLINGDYDKDKAVQIENLSAATAAGSKLSGDDYLVQEMYDKKDSYLTISDNRMLAQLKLPLRGDGQKYTKNVIEKFLKRCGIVYGVNSDAVDRIVTEFDPNEKYIVATGKEVINGTNGFYDYFFDIEGRNEPQILKDGTADLTDVGNLQQVKVGDKIAFYHKATRGLDGYDVFGNFVKAVPGKETPILKGNGFMIMNDRVTYVATITGAISMVDGKVDIRKLMVVQDVKITDKRIKYDGSIYVVGDVHSGSVIEATGDIVIGGHMESSDISAGGRVLIKGGVTAPIRGSVTAGGDITAKYFEGSTISGENISANYFFNCKIDSRGSIKTLGRSGTIYGGTINALYGVEAAQLGNKTGAKTIVNIGVNSNILNQYNNTQKAINRESEQLEVLNKEKDRLKEVGAGSRELMQWKVKINAAVTSKEIRIKELLAEQTALQAEIDKGNGACVVVTEYIFANTILIISGVIYKAIEDRKTYDKLTFRTDAQKEKIVVI